MTLMTSSDIAEQLKLDPRQVDRLARDRTLPAIKIGRWWRFDPEAIQTRLKELSTCVA